MRHIKQMEDVFASLKDDIIIPDSCWEPVEDGWKGDWCYFQKGHTPWNKGKKGTCPEHQREIQSKMAIERNKQYKGENNPRAKTWRIVYEDGRIEMVRALQPWRIERGYNKAGLRKLQLGEWKRYKDIVSIEEVKSK